VCSGIVIRHDPGHTTVSPKRGEGKPQEAEEESKAIVTPTCVVYDFDKDGVAVILVGLHNGEGDDGCKCAPNIEEGVILMSVLSR